MTEEKKKEKKQAETQVPLSIASPDKIIPKLCTHISFGITQDKHVLITLNFQAENQNILIERVVTTFEHAKTIAKVLNELIEKVEEDGTNNKPTK